ncbi:MAG: hypothetical protein ABI767_13450 [Rhodanobacter sp.]
MEKRAIKKSLFVISPFALGLPALAAAPVQTQSRHHHHQVCENVRVKRNDSKDDHRLIASSPHRHRHRCHCRGPLGHQVGGGKGKTFATVGGDAADGYVGNRVQKNAQDEKTCYTSERKCHDAYD